jgi:hypothetical protein
MTRDEIVDEVIELLRQHKKGWRGSIHQDPYKSDFFALFAKAYNAGLMRHGWDDVLFADALADCIADRAPELLDLDPRGTWVNLHTFWMEWTYAWQHMWKWRDPTDVERIARSLGSMSGISGEA